MKLDIGLQPNQLSWQSKEELVSILRKSIAKVTFTKKDGSPREMLCTLLEEHLVFPEKITNGDPAPVVKKPQDDTMANVWDCEAKGWRKIIINNITNVVLV